MQQVDRAWAGRRSGQLPVISTDDPDVHFVIRGVNEALSEECV